MLNLLVILLVALNAGLFAYQQGALSSFFPDEHEPTRISQQLNPDRIQILSLPQSDEKAEIPEELEAAKHDAKVAAVAEPATERPVEAKQPAVQQPAEEKPTQPVASAVAPTPTPAPSPGPRLACYAVSNLNPTTARNFERQLAQLQLGVQPSRQEVSEAGSYMVLYPAQGSRAAADSKVAELRQAGVTELYVMAENSAHPWAISLGVFRAEEAARVQLAQLTLKGVQGAKLVPHTMTLKAVTFQFRNIDEDTRTKIAQLASRFELARSAACS